MSINGNMIFNFNTMRLTLIIIATCFCVGIVKGQVTLGAEMNTGYSSAKMSDLKQTMTHYQSAIYPNLKLTDNYPAYVNFGGRAFVNLGRAEFSADYKYYSTGARKQYKDYTGEIGFDQLLHAHAVGASVRYSIIKKQRFSVDLSAGIMVYLSASTIDEYLRLAGADQDVKVKTVSRSAGIQPMIGFTYYFSPLLRGGVRGGYNVDYKATLHLSGDSGSALQDDNGKNINTDWTGFRSELFLAVSVATLQQL
jgi:hypothetical protein